MHLSVLEAQIRSVLDRASNGEEVRVEEEWIEEAGEQFKAALRKQFAGRSRNFRLRMSNIGRPLCQLQMEKAGATPMRREYNFIMRMLMGDAAEILTRFVLKAANVAVTSDGDGVKLDVAGVTVKGESDLDVGGKVFDVKSASPYSFTHKFQRGYKYLKETDDFGYVGQLFGYSDAQDKEPGGWIVVNKSSGEIAVLSVDETPEGVAEIRKEREEKVSKIISDAPFARCFEAEDEVYRRQNTGRKILPKPCQFCDYLHSCWPEAKREIKEVSTARQKPFEWYAE